MAELVLRVAAKAVITNDKDNILILREAPTYKDGSNVGKYHLPGGRLNEGEAFYDGLRREILEESGLEVEVLHPLYVGEWRPVIRGVPYQIIGMYMLCKAKTADVRLSEEHNQYLWINPAEYERYEMLEFESHAIKMYIDTLQA